MRLVIISGRSGSGKSTALHQLEDLGFYCVDNLPATLLPQLTLELDSSQYAGFKGVAVCIDARNRQHDLARIGELLQSLREDSRPQVVFLDASDAVLIKRFSETRRKHPLSNHQRSLAEAIAHERTVLEPLAAAADLSIDTTGLNLYNLRSLITSRLGDDTHDGLSLLIESFGFKRGVPSDADLVFDARLLPNPHWVAELRALTGREQPVAEFLEGHPETDRFLDDIVGFLERWLPHYASSQRSYITVAIGCTGGQHRSVFLAERAHTRLSTTYQRCQLRHRELEGREPA